MGLSLKKFSKTKTLFKFHGTAFKEYLFIRLTNLVSQHKKSQVRFNTDNLIKYPTFQLNTTLYLAKFN